MTPFLLHWLPIWASCAVIGALVGWFGRDALYGPQPRWFENTRYVFWILLRQEERYWDGYWPAKYGERNPFNHD